MDIKLIISLAGLALSILFPLIAYIRSRREYRNYYSVMWKNSRKLKPSEILGERPYREFYLQRNIDILLQREFERRKNVLITGPPLSGKTRTVLNALKTSGKKFSVLMPRAVYMPKFSVPIDFRFWRTKLIFIDDLQYYTEKQDNYHLLFKTAGVKKIPVVATCHSGAEFTKVKNRLHEHNLDVESLFKEIIAIEKLSEDEARAVANNLGIDWSRIIFNGTIGSLFMRLGEMEKRYEQLNDHEKTILEVIKILYLGGIYSDGRVFRIEHIKKAALLFELEGKEFEWRKWLSNLEGEEFLSLEPGKGIKCEEVYIEYIVKSYLAENHLEAVKLLDNIFTDDIEALISMAVKIYMTGLVSKSMPEYLRTGAVIFMKVFEKGSETQKRKAAFHLGMTYWHLSIVDDTSGNAEKAIGFFNHCLEFIERESEPVEYARILCKKANAYTALSEVKDSENNSKTAIKLYLDAREIFLRFREYSEYAKTLNNLGAAYLSLSQISARADNLKQALKYSSETLKYLNEITPEEYAGTLNNIGIAYARFADIEYPMLNIQKSIATFEKILELNLQKKSPVRHAITLNNLGIAYSTLANFKDKEKNLTKALEYFNETLKFRDPVEFPLQYSNTIYNIADTYLSLGKVKKSKQDIKSAIEIFTESLKYRNKELYSVNYGLTLFSMGKSYMELALYEDRTDNYHKAISLFDEALEIFKEDIYPEMNKKIHDEITAVKKIFFM